jgi:molybdate transport system substrate-binding protein
MLSSTKKLLIAATLLTTPLAACGDSDDGGGSDTSTLTVFAAASLTNTFSELGKQFEADHDGTTVRFSFGGSSDLVEQIRAGAPADVFASADTKNMDKAANAALLAGPPVNFASNTLTIAVAPGNPKGIKTFQDLTRPGLDVVVCAPQVPCGAATQAVETKTAVTLSPVSEESAVTDVLNKVTSGQADAGLVYVTDTAAAGGKVLAVPFPEAAGAVNTYPIATLKESGNPALASRFVGLVTGSAGQALLTRAGFGKP